LGREKKPKGTKGRETEKTEGVKTKDQKKQTPRESSRQHPGHENGRRGHHCGKKDFERARAKEKKKISGVRA